MSNPLVSVIVPVYNAEKYLSECIESVMSQTYVAWELLLVDDGSKDNSGEICDQYAQRDNHIRVIHKANGGVSSARNLGIKEAEGKYVIFLDSDDYWIGTESLQKLVNKAEVDNLDLVRGGYTRFEEGEKPVLWDFSEAAIQDHHVMDSFTMVNDVMRGEFFSVLFLFKASIIKQLYFDETLVFGEDINFLITLFCRDLRCGSLSIGFYAYRQLMTSASNICNVKNVINSFSFCDRYYQCALKTSDKRLSNLYIYNSIMMYYWTMQTLSNNVYYKKYKEVDNLVHLEQLRQQVKGYVRLVEHKSIPVHIYLSPKNAVRLFRIKLGFLELLKKVNLLSFLKRIGILKHN